MTDIPFDKRLWKAQEVAEYLGWDYDTFMKSKRFQGGFPAPLPAFKGHPRWSAQEVADWALFRGDSRDNHANATITQ